MTIWVATYLLLVIVYCRYVVDFFISLIRVEKERKKLDSVIIDLKKELKKQEEEIEKENYYRKHVTFYRLEIIFKRLFKLSLGVIVEQYMKNIKNNKKISNYRKEIEDYNKKLDKKHNDKIYNKRKEIEEKIKIEQKKAISIVKENIRQRFNYIPERIFNWMFNSFYRYGFKNAFNMEENEFINTVQNYVDEMIKTVEDVSTRGYLVYKCNVYKYSELFNDDELDKFYSNIIKKEPLIFPEGKAVKREGDSILVEI